MTNELNLLSAALLLLFGLALGIAIGTWVARRLSASQSAAMAERLKSESIAELATTQERARGLEADVQKLDAELAEARRAANGLRNELDAARDDRAQLAERAGRVPVLEADLAQAKAQLQEAQARILQVSTKEAEQARELQVQGKRNSELVGELDSAATRVKELTQSLAGALAKCAGLQADNERIAPLLEQAARLEQENGRLQSTVAALREDLGRIQAELQAEKEAHALVRSQAAQTQEQLERAQLEVSSHQVQLSELTTRLESERTQSEEKLALLLEAKDALSNQFKSLASDILEEKSKRFTEQNQNNLGQLLDPLKTRLQEFQGKIELFYDTEGKQRSALAQQVSQLMELNKTLSDDAKNLTLALKGSSKSQGNWGELILERVLEASGLRKGEEYDVQESHTRDDGSRAQPDVVIHLPENRHLVVDAKVSLTAYEEYASAETESERQASVRRHLDSIRSHIKGLSERNYQALYGLQSLDFVLMFVPIEPAFMLGVTQDNKLFMDAWSKNVLLVSPSTLLFVVRTVAHLWRQEAQNRNAQEIARRGGELYDRFVAFVADLEKIGDRLRQAKESYDEAFAKLSTNKGNVIRQAEMLKELGVKPNKALPRPLLEAAGATSEE